MQMLSRQRALIPNVHPSIFFNSKLLFPTPAHTFARDVDSRTDYCSQGKPSDRAGWRRLSWALTLFWEQIVWVFLTGLRQRQHTTVTSGRSAARKWIVNIKERDWTSHLIQKHFPERNTCQKWHHRMDLQSTARCDEPNVRAGIEERKMMVIISMFWCLNINDCSFSVLMIINGVERSWEASRS